MPETAAPPVAPDAPVVEQTPEQPVDKPLGENGEKALKAERDARAAADKKAADLQKQLDDIAAANLSDLEKAQKAATDAQAEVSKAQAEALRFRVAAKHQISDEDAELFLTGSDLETLEKQAVRLTERGPASPKPDPSQGARGSQGASADPAQAFAQFMKSQTGR